MTTGYATDHPRYEAAQRFGVQLQAAMTRRKRRPHHVYVALGGGFSSYQFHLWLDGGALPRLDRAIKLAEFLDWPSLAEIVREARTGICERPGCGASFVTEGGKSRKYCSPRCRQIVHDYITGRHRERKKQDDVEAAASLHTQTVAADRDQLLMHRQSVAHFCDGCEPEGYCRTPDCALRTVSPLPLMRAEIPSQDLAHRRERPRLAAQMRERRARSKSPEAEQATQPQEERP